MIRLTGVSVQGGLSVGPIHYLHRTSASNEKRSQLSPREEQLRFEAPAGIELAEKALVFSNYEFNFVIANGFTTRPYELRVYLFPAKEDV